MKWINRIPRWVRNKYLLSTAGFIVWMLFFDPRDLFSQFQRTRELHNLEASKQHYEAQIAVETAELQQLKTSPALMEKYAREKYLMKRDNEDIFIVSREKKQGN